MAHISLDSLIYFGSENDFEPIDLARPLKEGNRTILHAEALRECARIAFSKIAYIMPHAQYAAFTEIIDDPTSSLRERFVAASLLENALIASRGSFPICQDTGTALVYGWRGDHIDIEDGLDLEELLATGASEAYAREKLRNSQLGPFSMTEERNTQDNLPAGIQIRSVPGDKLKLVFVAKGGGSTSRTSLTMESPAILREDRLEEVLRARIQALGPSGCPPYAIAVVLGGANPSQTLYAAELAALGLLDALPESASGDGTPVRDRLWEHKILEIARESGLGAQWGGSHMAVSARAIRLSRHAANLPLAVAVSCAANRHVEVYVDHQGWHIQKLVPPVRKLENTVGALLHQVSSTAPSVEISETGTAWLEELRSCAAGTILLLSGPVLVARDAAHARLLKILETEKKLPDWFIGLPVFYAGPTEAKEDHATGSFGPTTASRMDSYLEPFMGAGASLVTIAKGSRSLEAQKAISKHRGVYLAAIGGAAALNADRHVRSLSTIQFEELGMEAVRVAVLERMPLIVAIDSKGNDMYRTESGL
jgi:fumarate hydratase class I